MKKRLNILFRLVISFLIIVSPIVVFADNDDDPMITVEASQSNGNVYIHGTVIDRSEEDFTLAVAIVVYKENGTDLAGMKTVQTKAIGELPPRGSDQIVCKIREYSTTMALSPGTYVIKAADYRGGPFAKTKITVAPEPDGEETTPEEETVPEEEKTTPEKETVPEEKISEETENSQEAKTTSSKNPMTSDNIMKVVTIFIMAGLGLFALIIINTKKQKDRAVK